MVRRLAALLGIALLAAACGGGAGTIGMPTPTPTPPPPGGFGTVNGTAVATPTALATPAGVSGQRVPVRRTLGRPTYVPDQILVKPVAGAAEAAVSALHTRFGARVIHTIDRLGAQVIRLGPGQATASVLAAYRASGLFEYAEQDAYAYASATPSDPSYPSQVWHYGQLNLPPTWDVTTGGAVIVAVLDTGMRSGHPDMTTVTVSGFDWIVDPANGDGDGPDADPTDPGCPNVNPPEFSHGVHVAGTIAARTNNGAFGAGVNWGGVAGTRIMPLRVLGQAQVSPGTWVCGMGTFSDVANAITWAADHGAAVINMSFGGNVGPITAVENAISYARGLGATMVAAAGNDGCSSIDYPASNSQVIAVGATGNTSPPARASYSDCGAALDVVAPGGDGSAYVWSSTWSRSAGNTFVGFQGTSMATAHVSGVIALMISRGVTGPANIQNVLQSTATNLGPPGFDPETGWGLVNALAALGAGAGPRRQCAFTGTISGTTISRESAMVSVMSSGGFTINDAPSGVKSVFVWQDADGSNTINTGDPYGRLDGVSIFPGGTTTVSVNVQTYGTGSLAGQPTLTVTPGGASSCP